MLLTRNKAVRQIAGLLETANFLMLKLALKKPGALRVYPGYVFRQYMSLVQQGHWVSRSFFELFPDVTSLRVTLEHAPGGGIYTPVDELAYLALITAAVQPRRIFEIGTFRGRTALNFALNAPADCTVYTLDLPPEVKTDAADVTNAADAKLIGLAAAGSDYEGKDVAGKIKQLYGDSTTYDFSPHFGQTDIVFVDGAHHYEAALSDTRNALKMVRPGGYVIWHDFANYGDYNDVTRAILDVIPGGEVVQVDSTQLAVYHRPAAGGAQTTGNGKQ